MKKLLLYVSWSFTFLIGSLSFVNCSAEKINKPFNINNAPVFQTKQDKQKTIANLPKKIERENKDVGDNTIVYTDLADSPLPTVSMLPFGNAMLLDFSSDYCMPCKIMKPWLKDLTKKYKGEVDIIEINIDEAENDKLGIYFQARQVPTQIYIDKKGNIVDRNVGLATMDQMENKLKVLKFLTASD